MSEPEENNGRLHVFVTDKHFVLIPSAGAKDPRNIEATQSIITSFNEIIRPTAEALRVSEESVRRLRAREAKSHVVIVSLWVLVAILSVLPILS